MDTFYVQNDKFTCIISVSCARHSNLSMGVLQNIITVPLYKRASLYSTATPEPCKDNYYLSQLHILLRTQQLTTHFVGDWLYQTTRSVGCHCVLNGWTTHMPLYTSQKTTCLCYQPACGLNAIPQHVSFVNPRRFFSLRAPGRLTTNFIINNIIPLEVKNLTEQK